MPNKIYQANESAIEWTDSGGDEALDLGGLAADAGRVGEFHDFGASSRSRLYAWMLVIDGFDTAPVPGEQIDVYWAESAEASTATTSGPVAYNASADAALSDTSLLRNLRYLGSANIHSTTAGDDVIAEGLLEVNHRYGAPVIHNNSADALLSTSDSHRFIITPIPPEVQ